MHEPYEPSVETLLGEVKTSRARLMGRHAGVLQLSCEISQFLARVDTRWPLQPCVTWVRMGNPVLPCQWPEHLKPPGQTETFGVEHEPLGGLSVVAVVLTSPCWTPPSSAAPEEAVL